VRRAVLIHVQRLLLAALLVAPVACSENDLGISDSLYVQTMAELQRVQRERGPAERRDSVLEASGVTPEQLEEAAMKLAEQPQRAAELWRAIDRQSRLPR